MRSAATSSDGSEKRSGPVWYAKYFVVAEALTNIAKHARAGRAEVTARVQDGRLAVQVRDDGIGGAAPGQLSIARAVGLGWPGSSAPCPSSETIAGARARTHREDVAELIGA